MNTNMKKKREKGITLIALVITIIVLLILAGISIATLTGNNGILTQAQNAKNETTKGKEVEQIRLAWNSYVTDYLTNEGDDYETDDVTKKFQNELDGLEGTGKTEVDMADGELLNSIQIKYKETGNTYYLGFDENGNAVIKSKDEIAENMKYETSSLTDSEKTNLEDGIKLEINSGDDREFTMELATGTIVDWGDGKYSKIGKAFTGKTNSKENIIKIAELNDKFSDVSTSSIKLAGLFEASTVYHKYMEKNTSYVIKIYKANLELIQVTNTEKLSKILDWGKCNIDYLGFSSCTKLTEIATPQKDSFSSDFYNMTGCFSGCTSLKQIPSDFFTNIPEIKYVDYMFENCTSLTGNAPEIWKNSKITKYEECFKGCTNLANYSSIPDGWK